MGEKETMTAADEAAKSGALNVSASPGGSPSAGILAAAVPSVGQRADDGDPLASDAGSGDRKGVNAVNVKLA